MPIQFHEESASSVVFDLRGDEEDFQEGEVDTFPIFLRTSHLPLHTLTLSHGNTGPYPEWHVDKVAIDNGRTGETYGQSLIGSILDVLYPMNTACVPRVWWLLSSVKTKAELLLLHLFSSTSAGMYYYLS